MIYKRVFKSEQANEWWASMKEEKSQHRKFFLFEEYILGFFFV